MEGYVMGSIRLTPTIVVKIASKRLLLLYQVANNLEVSNFYAPLRF